MRIIPIAVVSILLSFPARLAAQKDKSRHFDLESPGGATRVTVSVGAEGLQWSVSHRGQPVIAPSALGLELVGGEQLDGRSVPLTAVRKTSDEWIAALNYKKDSIRDRYSQLTLRFPKAGYGVIFRAYDDGAAYRWYTQRKDSLTIRTERADFRFPADDTAWVPYVNDPGPDIWTTSFENFYRAMPLSEFRKDTLAFLPVLVNLGQGRKAAILEADLEDYPGMFLGSIGDSDKPATGTAFARASAVDAGLTGKFAPFPLAESQGGHNQLQSLVRQRAGYIAVTAGTRTFPWRIVVCSDKDRDLADNDMVYRLASPPRVSDVSWIRPGKVAWDWWNDWNISKVDFRAGINTATYKYYIDFAAENHLGYILLDEGWSDPGDLMKIVPAIDLQAIIDYGRRRNVGVWLWAGMLPLDRNMDEVMQHYSGMGIKGFKVDFMNRDDQRMVRFYYRAARTAAADHLMLDFHGAYKPTGLQRTYPNVLNFEGVRGMENEKWSNDDFPGYDVTIPFIRMLAGPLDYTPGAMKNYNKANFRPVFSEPMSQGTRCHQLAMYVVYEAPFSMLSDNPTNYRREPESVQFMAGVPTTFDETRSLDGEVGQYVVMARRKGAEWWVGAMTNWTERDLTLDLSFLPAGDYRADIMRDGINADRDGTDYIKQEAAVTRDSRLTIHLAPGGGWVAAIRPVTAGSSSLEMPPPAIDINQVGFYPRAPKLAVVTGVRQETAFYIVSMERGDTLFTGKLGPQMASTNSSLDTRLADFSEFNRAGVYSMVVPGIGRSHSFRIGAGMLYPVAKMALKGFYYLRSGVALTPEYAGRWSRAGGRDDHHVLVHPSAASTTRPAGTVIATPGGWFDAGDYNKYIVNSGITVGTLLDAYEDFHGFWDTLHTHIPPIAGVPDLLNEALYNLRWMLTMQDPADGGVYHKCTDAAFDGMVMPDVTRTPRYVVQKGTAATLDFAAVMAQAARIFRTFGDRLPGLSDSCLHAATAAWQWALKHPDVVYDQNRLNTAFVPAITTGAYGDRRLGDELFWAAAELLVSTGDDQYAQVVRERLAGPVSLPSWSNVQMMGDYTLLRFSKSLPASWEPALRAVRDKLLQLADGYVAGIGGNAFHTVIGESRRDFVWGSNSVAANQGILLVDAWLQTGNDKYLAPALANMDYLLGMNATGFCFITGVGTHSTLHPHHRPSVADGVDAPVPGLLAGGPNPGQQDHQHYPYQEPETSYADQDQAYASNEIAINWNAPLVYLAGALEAIERERGAL